MRLSPGFYERDVLVVAPELLGKMLIKRSDQGLFSYMITEVEAYGGIEDQASHARFGKTVRNSVMFGPGGILYIYFIYGMYWMMNIVTGTTGQAQAILIRGLGDISGPGRVGRILAVDRSYNGENLFTSDRIWVEDHKVESVVIQKPRFGIDYAGEPWKSKPWRYTMAPPLRNS